MKLPKKNWIICAALRYKGEVFKGHRHCHCYPILNYVVEYRGDTVDRALVEDGFIDSNNEFVDRKEAAEAVVASGQLRPDGTPVKPFRPDTLYSEDLY